MKHPDKNADDNLTIDKTSWANCGYGEAGSCLTGRLYGKKVTRGGQTVILTDAGRCRPRSYIHMHKVHQMPDNFTRQGCMKAWYLLEKCFKMLDDSEAPEKSSEGHFAKSRKGWIKAKRT